MQTVLMCNQKDCMQKFSPVSSLTMGTVFMYSIQTYGTRSDVVKVDANVNLNAKVLESPSGDLVSVQKMNDGNWLFLAKNVSALSPLLFSGSLMIREGLQLIARSFMTMYWIMGIVRVEIDKIKGTISSFSKKGEEYNYAAERGLNDYVYTGRLASDTKWVENIKKITVLNDGEVGGDPSCRVGCSGLSLIVERCDHL